VLPSSHVLKHAIKPLASQSLKRRKSADVMRRRLPAQFGSRKTSTTGAPGREVGGLGEGGGDEGGGGEGEGGDAGGLGEGGGGEGDVGMHTSQVTAHNCLIWGDNEHTPSVFNVPQPSEGSSRHGGEGEGALVKV